LTRAAVGQWDKVPAERLPEIEALTGFPRWMLRGDIVPPPPLAVFRGNPPAPVREPTPPLRRTKRLKESA
jgi:hypothetical protein